MLGFREIGRGRKARIVGSRKYDVVPMDILAEQFSLTYVPSLVAE